MRHREWQSRTEAGRPLKQGIFKSVTTGGPEVQFGRILEILPPKGKGPGTSIPRERGGWFHSCPDPLLSMSVPGKGKRQTDTYTHIEGEREEKRKRGREMGKERDGRRERETGVGDLAQW